MLGYLGYWFFVLVDGHQGRIEIIFISQGMSGLAIESQQQRNLLCQANSTVTQRICNIP